MSPPPPEKICSTCGRPFAWRRKWADCWHEVRYCSKKCRGGPSGLDREVESVLRRMLARRPPPATLCPSEVARAVFREDEWRGGMERVRRAGRRLAMEGLLEVTQGGRAVDPGTARGPIRYRASS
jgi:hypothetical protein